MPLSSQASQLSLFEAVQEPQLAVVNVARVAQLSPFRYPGGKTWFVPFLRRWLQSLGTRPDYFLEPFGGGGICSLTVAQEGLAGKVLLNELDEDVAAVWKVVLSKEAALLIELILNFSVTPETVSELLGRVPTTTLERAFQTIVKNRTVHGGILAPGSGFIKVGENGKGLKSRWYPETIACRIDRIYRMRERIIFSQDDAFQVISEYKNVPHSALFLDPPYTVGGKKAGARLYRHHQVDHERLFQECSSSALNALFTYDDATQVRSLAQKYDLQFHLIPMKNTHHSVLTELVIGQNLDWLITGSARVVSAFT